MVMNISEATKVLTMRIKEFGLVISASKIQSDTKEKTSEMSACASISWVLPFVSSNSIWLAGIAALDFSKGAPTLVRACL